MRYANEGRHLLPQGSTTGVPHKNFYHRAVPQEYHRLVTTGQYYMLMHVTTRHVYVPHVPEQYHTLVTTGQCHTLVTTEQYNIPQYYIGEYTT